MRWFVGSTLMLFVLGASLMADDTPKTVFDFSGTDAAKEWQTVNDGVMGGVWRASSRLPTRRRWNSTAPYR